MVLVGREGLLVAGNTHYCTAIACYCRGILQYSADHANLTVVRYLISTLTFPAIPTQPKRRLLEARISVLGDGEIAVASCTV